MKAEDMDRPKRRVPNTKPKKETKCPKKASNVHDPSQNYRKYLSNQYGPEIIIEWRKTEKTAHKLARVSNHLTFLCRCREKRLIPPGLRLKSNVENNRRVKNIQDQAGRALVRERIYNNRAQKSHLQSAYQQQKELLLGKININADKERMNKALDTSYSHIYKKTKDNHIRKLQQLIDQTTPHQEKMDPINSVINLSSRLLSDSEQSILNKGLNFAMSEVSVPHLKFIAPIERITDKLPKVEAEELKWKVHRTLMKSRPPKSNISSEENRALKNLRNDESITIIPADKGNATVILNRTDYRQKLQDIIEKGNYKIIKKDPTLTTERKLKSLLKSVKDYLSPQTHKWLNPNYSRLPFLYGVAKIHKQGTPLRPIVSCVESATQPLSRHLADILKPLSGLTPTHVKNSAHFVERLKDAPISTSLMVSFDVVNLFGMIPVDEALVIIREKLENDEDLEERSAIPVNSLMELVTFCLKTAYFQLENQTYQQVDGVAMGSALSPIVSNIYMEHFEELALNTAQLKPDLWLRYVDDTFILWSHNENVEALLTHMNSIRPSIQFTMEKESNGQLPFLDVLVERQDDGFSTSVYRKATNTGRYLNFYSNHPFSVKIGLINSLTHRAATICSSRDGERRVITWHSGTK